MCSKVTESASAKVSVAENYGFPGQILKMFGQIRHVLTRIGNASVIRQPNCVFAEIAESWVVFSKFLRTEFLPAKSHFAPNRPGKIVFVECFGAVVNENIVRGFYPFLGPGALSQSLMLFNTLM